MRFASDRVASLRESKLSLLCISLLTIVSTVYVYNDSFSELSKEIIDSRTLRGLKKKMPTTVKKNLIWLLGFPGAGSEKVIDLVEHATMKSMGTNYGDILTKGWKRHMVEYVPTKLQPEWYTKGPFKNNIDLPADTNDIIVRTSCTGYCRNRHMQYCSGKAYLKSLTSMDWFKNVCTRGRNWPRNERVWGARPYADANDIRKAIVLVRNPIAMVGDRMALSMMRREKLNRIDELEYKHFVRYCEKVDRVYMRMEEFKELMKPNAVNRAALGIPCYTEYLRIMLWYKNVYLMAADKDHIEVRWEDLYTELDGPAQSLLSFAGLERVKNVWRFDQGDAKAKDDWFTGLIPVDIYDRIGTFMKTIASDDFEKVFVEYFLKPQPAISRFTKIDNKEQCKFGYYAGGEDDEDASTMTYERCAEICESEEKCLFFAATPNETCNRFDNSGGDGCQRRVGNYFRLYRKNPPAYTTSVLSKFTKLDNWKYCKDGYYAGYDDDADSRSMTLGRCADICESEEKCVYFAVKPMYSCSRFDETANDCKRRTGSEFKLYKKNASD